MSVDFCPKKIDFEADDDEDDDVLEEEEEDHELEPASLSETSTTGGDVTSSNVVKRSDDVECRKLHVLTNFDDTPEVDKPEIVAKNKKVCPPPIPPRVSSLPTSTPVASSPLSQKIASSK